jgi:hypothetical protein
MPSKKSAAVRAHQAADVRDPDPECRSMAGLGLDANFATEQRRRKLADSQPKAKTLRSNQWCVPEYVHVEYGLRPDADFSAGQHRRKLTSDQPNVKVMYTHRGMSITSPSQEIQLITYRARQQGIQRLVWARGKRSSRWYGGFAVRAGIVLQCVSTR